MSNYKNISILLNNILEILFPGICVVCGNKLIFNSKPFYLICSSCMNELNYISGTRCKCCSTELISEIGVCTRCRNIKYYFNSNTSIFEYRGSAKEIIYQYKFKKRKRLSIILADLLVKTVCEFGPHLPIIPVPSANRRDHIIEIAKRMKNKYKFQIINCLRRKGSIPQKMLYFKERLNNLKGKIFVNQKQLKGLEEVILLDDIITTGATVSECSRVLKEGGVRKIYVVTIAID